MVNNILQWHVHCSRNKDKLWFSNFVKDQLRKVLELAASIDQKIEDTADTEKEAKIQAFQAKEQLIANQLQNILLALQGIKIEGSSLTAIEKASQNVEKILGNELIIFPYLSNIWIPKEH